MMKMIVVVVAMACCLWIMAGDESVRTEINRVTPPWLLAQIRAFEWRPDAEGKLVQVKNIERPADFAEFYTFLKQQGLDTYYDAWVKEHTEKETVKFKAQVEQLPEATMPVETRTKPVIKRAASVESVREVTSTNASDKVKRAAPVRLVPNYVTSRNASRLIVRHAPIEKSSTEGNEANEERKD